MSKQDNRSVCITLPEGTRFFEGTKRIGDTLTPCVYCVGSKGELADFWGGEDWGSCRDTLTTPPKDGGQIPLYIVNARRGFFTAYVASPAALERVLKETDGQPFPGGKKTIKMQVYRYTP